DGDGNDVSDSGDSKHRAAVDDVQDPPEPGSQEESGESRHRVSQPDPRLGDAELVEAPGQVDHQRKGDLLEETYHPDRGERARTPHRCHRAAQRYTGRGYARSRSVRLFRVKRVASR